MRMPRRQELSVLRGGGERTFQHFSMKFVGDKGRRHEFGGRGGYQKFTTYSLQHSMTTSRNQFPSLIQVQSPRGIMKWLWHVKQNVDANLVGLDCNLPYNSSRAQLIICSFLAVFWFTSNVIIMCRARWFSSLHSTIPSSFVVNLWDLLHPKTNERSITIAHYNYN